MGEAGGGGRHLPAPPHALINEAQIPSEPEPRVSQPVRIPHHVIATPTNTSMSLYLSGSLPQDLPPPLRTLIYSPLHPLGHLLFSSYLI